VSGDLEGDLFESAARQLTLLGKKKIAALIDSEGPPFPEVLGYLWLWFSQHSMGLAATGMSYPVITWEGLWAWSQLLQIELEPWEVDLMMQLSCIRANVHVEKMEAERKQKK
jgi:hypothetical protein